jgi:glycosyltransferase involved in cell wall biosynthesis
VIPEPAAGQKNLDGLQLRGPYYGASGYDQLVRELARALNARRQPLQLMDISHWYPLRWPGADLDPLFESLTRPVSARIRLHICMPPQVKTVRGLSHVNYTMFEADRVPEAWIRCNRRHDLVILPHAECGYAWIRSGLPEAKVRICPQGVDADRFKPGQVPLPLPRVMDREVMSFRFRVLHMADYTPRKNLAGLLRVWLQATRRSDDAILICKINCAVAKWQKKLDSEIRQVQDDSGVTLDQAAPILFLRNRLLPPAAMPRLFACATHYWSMSFGEGWDLPMMEAAAGDLQLIAPFHSAYRTYLNERCAWLIPTRQVAATFSWDRPTERLFRGTAWWQPDHDTAVDILRQILHLDRRTAESARIHIAAKYSWANSADRLVQILQEHYD